MSGRNLGKWLQDEHPNITEHLFMGVPDADPERIEALRSPTAMEAWVKRNYPELHKEWKASEGGQ